MFGFLVVFACCRMFWEAFENLDETTKVPRKLKLNTGGLSVFGCCFSFLKVFACFGMLLDALNVFGGVGRFL